MDDLDENGIVQETEGTEETLGFWNQLVLVFSDPAAAFNRLVAHPRWVGAFLVVAVVTVAGTQATYPLIMQMQRDAITQNPQLSEEQADLIMQRYERPLTPVWRVMTSAFQVIGIAIWLVIMSAVLMFGGNILLGGEAKFKTILAVATHSWLVTIPKMLLTAPLMLAKGSAAVSTSLQVLIPADRWMTPLGVALGAFDLFSIWMVVLIIIGISAAYRFSRAKSAAIVVSLYVFMVLVGVAFSALGRGLMAG